MYFEKDCPIFENQFSKNKKILIFLFVVVSILFLIEQLIRKLNIKTETNKMNGEFIENNENVENWKLILLCLFSFFLFFTASFFLIKFST